MKKTLILTLACLTLLCACEKKKSEDNPFVCELCHEESSDRRYLIEFPDGEYIICKMCNDTLPEIYRDLSDKLVEG